MPTVMPAGPQGAWEDGCAAFLADHGSQVESTGTGVDCLPRLRAGWTDMLVLAADLPWGGGDGVLAAMRDDPSGVPEPPLVRVLGSPVPPAAVLEVLKELGHRPGDGERLEQLVVDNNSGIRRLLRGFLEFQGHTVWTVEDGEEALDLCCEHGEHIAAVLLDVHMPALDGPHTFEGLQAYDPSLPVCFMSADVTEAEAAELRRFGARHVFHEPFRLDEVSRVMRALASEPRGVPQGA